jgi:hypothetical protein
MQPVAIHAGRERLSGTMKMDERLVAQAFLPVRVVRRQGCLRYIENYMDFM